MENKLLTYIKEEVARDLGIVDYKNFCDAHTSDEVDTVVTEIATRFAAAQTEQMISDIRELRSLIENWVEIRNSVHQGGGFDDEEVEQEFTSGLIEVLTKTQHYEK